MQMTLQFLGAAREVTGSCHLVTVAGKHLLLDCGLIQGGKADELRNHEPFVFDPQTIVAVVLSHAHIDHSGRLPLLVKAGFDGPIYTHKATAELCAIMLKDAAMLQVRDTERTNKKRAKHDLAPLEPLFTVEDAEQAISQFVSLEYGQVTRVIPHVDICLSDAGHILGSALVELWLGEGKSQKKIVFSGDLGRAGMPILQNPTLVDTADLVLMESTYGNRFHRSWTDTLAELKDIFAKTVNESQGNILLPAFSVGRAQELLYLFHLYAKEWDLGRWKICLDSPMAIEATRVYVNNYPLMDEDFKRFTRQHPGQHPLLSNVEFIQTTEESIALNEVHKGLIIIAGSGMCNGGRIRSHLEHNLWRSECDVIICGFQALGTPGRALVDGAKELTIHGNSVNVAAKLHTVGGLSAHADQAELLRWYRHFEEQPPLVLVHGEPEAQQGLVAVMNQDPKTKPKALAIATRGDMLDLTALPKLVWVTA
ncbi:MBL fold metallo-hydrolase [Shewanella oneidensis MR-1]|uniref:RNA-metabolizing metallo-beta-lactamase family protein n=1 Tax=Shewanella oneidensis (strain ATCC 700550 / JCM 31522 / CIP 106686 / LMG 19005 / NCIMB 14063 / MR-1) TaxID=211586 RepID=Q8EJC6_SHEON|nr:MBL fold metallo-hydrolase [Shewanella oneidensis]AAN53622.2 RNA-metabolizing metallo-beta-lactamase family protein [Shewanella oneidensis MR-1]MDX5997524.1 MBL fold metallo-hydrolase [Shewanella oneidensis]MEE2026827.1 Ribonuclease [Shewanella oneidensis]QKG95446.1 MBL fold metallo-hydrolase [Shewanella oneidensis MR-1]